MMVLESKKENMWKHMHTYNFWQWCEYFMNWVGFCVACKTPLSNFACKTTDITHTHCLLNSTVCLCAFDCDCMFCLCWMLLIRLVLGFLQLNCSNSFRFRISFLICDEHLLGSYRLRKTFRLFWMLWLTQLIRLNVIDAMVMPINLRPLLRFHIHSTDNERARKNKWRTIDKNTNTYKCIAYQLIAIHVHLNFLIRYIIFHLVSKYGYYLNEWLIDQTNKHILVSCKHVNGTLYALVLFLPLSPARTLFSVRPHWKSFGSARFEGNLCFCANRMAPLANKIWSSSVGRCWCWTHLLLLLPQNVCDAHVTFRCSLLFILCDGAAVAVVVAISASVGVRIEIEA